MPATVTLTPGTLTNSVGLSDNEIRLATMEGIVPNLRIWVDRELMRVVGFMPDNWLKVMRGVDSTAGAPHSSSTPVLIGTADQFFQYDPTGIPPDVIPVSPHINVRTGDVFYAQGDPSGARWWQKAVVTYSAGALGVRIAVQEPSSST